MCASRVKLFYTFSSCLLLLLCSLVRLYTKLFFYSFFVSFTLFVCNSYTLWIRLNDLKNTCATEARIFSEKTCYHRTPGGSVDVEIFWVQHSDSLVANGNIQSHFHNFKFEICCWAAIFLFSRWKRNLNNSFKIHFFYSNLDHLKWSIVLFNFAIEFY